MTLTILPEGITMTPELLAMLMNNAGLSNGDQQSRTNMVSYNCGQIGYIANSCSNWTDLALVREAQSRLGLLLCNDYGRYGHRETIC